MPTCPSTVADFTPGQCPTEYEKEGLSILINRNTDVTSVTINKSGKQCSSPIIFENNQGAVCMKVSLPSVPSENDFIQINSKATYKVFPGVSDYCVTNNKKGCYGIFTFKPIKKAGICLKYKNDNRGSYRCKYK